MDRKAIARETLTIITKGYYHHNGKTIDIKTLQALSETRSETISPATGKSYVDACNSRQKFHQENYYLLDMSTVEALFFLKSNGIENIGILNFASAKNPGGGFLNGAMAQEESIAAASGLYNTLIKNRVYYDTNRQCNSMIYTDYAIYSPDVVFFRDKGFHLVECPVTASVLTLPAVNYGQVLQKGEDKETALNAMKDRMRLSLSIFAEKNAKHLILGAYGCGVFQNDPVLVAGWWLSLLQDEGFSSLFDSIYFAVMDRSKTGKCLKAFKAVFPLYLEGV